MKLEIVVPKDSCGFFYVKYEDGTELCTCYNGDSNNKAVAKIVQLVNLSNSVDETVDIQVEFLVQTLKLKQAEQTIEHLRKEVGELNNENQ